MTRTLSHRSTAALITAALTLGAAAPASAMRVLPDSQPSYGGPAPVLTSEPAPSTSGGISELGYLGIGTASVVLVGIGGTFTVTRRRRQSSASEQSTIAFLPRLTSSPQTVSAASPTQHEPNYARGLLTRPVSDPLTRAEPHREARRGMWGGR